MKHKYCEVIKAWADGAVIQRKYGSEWHVIAIPCWDDYAEYRASLAIVEGKPVFEGDVLYCGQLKITVIKENDLTHPCWSWNPPKQTITVTIPMPTFAIGHADNILEIKFNNHDEQIIACETIIKAMK